MVLEIFKRPTTTDARGRRVGIFDPYSPTEQFGLATLSKEKARTIRTRIEVGLPRWVRFLVGFAAIVVLAVILVMVFDTLRGGRSGKPILALETILAFGVSVLFGTYGAKTHRSRRTVRVMLDEGLCPTCAYDLRGTPDQSDGVTVCSECGSAWQMTAVGSLRAEQQNDS